MTSSWIFYRPIRSLHFGDVTHLSTNQEPEFPLSDYELKVDVSCFDVSLVSKSILDLMASVLYCTSVEPKNFGGRPPHSVLVAPFLFRLSLF